SLLYPLLFLSGIPDTLHITRIKRAGFGFSSPGPLPLFLFFFGSRLLCRPRMSAEFLNASVIVMPHIPVGLPEHPCNLIERVSFDKRQPQGLALFVREFG